MVPNEKPPHRMEPGTAAKSIQKTMAMLIMTRVRQQALRMNYAQ